MLIYLDTSSINRIYKELNKSISLKSLKNHTYVLSSCQIDEIGLISSAEYKSQLADLIFRISDQRKLKEHIAYFGEICHQFRLKPATFISY